jgi:hypothetical protein
VPRGNSSVDRDAKVIYYPFAAESRKAAQKTAEAEDCDHIRMMIPEYPFSGLWTTNVQLLKYFPGILMVNHGFVSSVRTSALSVLHFLSWPVALQVVRGDHGQPLVPIFITMYLADIPSAVLLSEVAMGHSFSSSSGHIGQLPFSLQSRMHIPSSWGHPLDRVVTPDDGNLTRFARTNTRWNARLRLLEAQAVADRQLMHRVKDLTDTPPCDRRPLLEETPTWITRLPNTYRGLEEKNDEIQSIAHICHFCIHERHNLFSNSALSKPWQRNARIHIAFWRTL